MSKAKKPVQLSLFEKQTAEEKPIEGKEPDLDSLVISHGKNFRIESPYLLDLSQYNNYLKKDWHKGNELLDDNLLLRTVFGGIKNSFGAPPEILEGLNGLEVCLIEGGIFKRKYVYFEDITVTPKGEWGYREPIKVRRDPSSHRYFEESRIKVDGHLDGKSLYEMIDHLLNATGIKQIYNRYKKEWKDISQKGNLSKEQKRFKRLNPYNPSTLKERMDYIEKMYPTEVEEFKKVLAKPFIPEKIVRIDKHGNPKKVINPEGFVTPGRTYRRGVRGRSFYNLREYANQVHHYFSNKERKMQNTNKTILK